MANRPRPTLKFFNTETREKIPFQPQQPPHVKLYTCGPTVYHYAHIGNFRTYVFEDLLRRTLKGFGYQVEQAMNITDVDDKTIKGAIEKGVSLETYTRPYIDAFFADLETLAIERVEHYPPATAYIDQMIQMIQTLIEKGVAYQGNDGSVYFAIKKFPRYGCLSHLKLDELQEGGSERVAQDEYEKDSACDFVLWKGYDAKRDGQIFWDSPFGPGRPGWHLECSTMAMEILGETLDIHVGGVDNIFPHHENEIAQSEACSNQRFAHLWMHSEHLLVDNKKMSKSLGNFYTLRDLLDKGYSGRQVRYLLLQTHYKTQLNFTLEGLQAAGQSIHRLDALVMRLKGKFPEQESPESIQSSLETGLEQFYAALADDLNISVALAALFEVARQINTSIDQGSFTAKDREHTLTALKEMNTILGLIDFQVGEEEVPQELTEAALKRDQARKDKNWALADELRDLIHQAGYTIDDTPNGSRVVKRKEEQNHVSKSTH